MFPWYARLWVHLVAQGDYPVGVEYEDMNESQLARYSNWNQVFRWYQILQRTGTPVSFESQLQ